MFFKWLRRRKSCLLIFIGIFYGYILQSSTEKKYFLREHTIFDQTSNLNRSIHIKNEILPRKLLLISLLKTSGLKSKKINSNNLDYDIKYSDLNEIEVISDLNRNYKDQYSWFFIIDESTFFFPYQVIDLATDLEHDLLFGHKKSKSTRCSAESGILISNNIIGKFTKHILFCNKSNDSTFEINQCINLLFDKECKSSTKNIKFIHFENDFIENGLQYVGDFFTISNFKMSATSIQSLENFKLKRYLLEMKQNELEMKKFSNINLDTNILYHHSNLKKKYEIIKPTFFNISHSFPIDKVIRKNSELENAEVKKLIHLSKKNFDESKYVFLNGYKSFSSIYGLVYKMIFVSKETKSIKSIILMRPLGPLQIISIDTFKQTSFLKKINLIFSIRDNSAQAWIPRLCTRVSKYSKFIKSANFLIINYSNSNITIPKLRIKGVKNKIDKIRLMDANLYYNDDYVQLETIRHFSKKISKNSLIVYMPSNVKFGRDALKRLVINAKIKKQVFFPIAYNFYPYSAKKSLLNTDNGYFDGESKDIVSFYNLDFIKFDNEKIRSTFELFNKSNVEILNVADSDLHLEWTIYKGCHFLNSNDSYKCINRRLNSFGNHMNFLSFLLKN